MTHHAYWSDSDFPPDNYVAIRDDQCGRKGSRVVKHGILVAHKKNLIVSEVKLLDKTSEFLLACLQVKTR